MAAGEAKAVRPGGGRVLSVLGNTFTLKVMAADTGDSYSVIEITSPPSGGLPPHKNTRESETHVILNGTYSFVLGTQTHEAGPGAVFFVPRGTLHAFQNVGRETGQVLLIPSPGANNEALVARLAERFGGGFPASGPDPAALEALAALARQYGVEPAIG
jgi:mannose-6-phosphate isomerase-like protein (cupin superfamily)